MVLALLCISWSHLDTPCVSRVHLKSILLDSASICQTIYSVLSFTVVSYQLFFLFSSRARSSLLVSVIGACNSSCLSRNIAKSILFKVSKSNSPMTPMRLLFVNWYRVMTFVSVLMLNSRHTPNTSCSSPSTSILCNRDCRFRAFLISPAIVSCSMSYLPLSQMCSGYSSTSPFLIGFTSCPIFSNTVILFYIE